MRIANQYDKEIQDAEIDEYKMNFSSKSGKPFSFYGNIYSRKEQNDW